MPSCPNCGRKALRTLDWACQWCGYPLLSKSYKKIDKTFKELQEERNVALRRAPTEEEPEYKTEPEPEYSPEPENEPAPRPEKALAPPLETEPTPAPAPPPASTPAKAPKPAGKRKSKAASKKESKSEGKPATESETGADPTPQPVSEQEPIIMPPPASVSEQEPMITPPPEPVSEQAPVVTPPPAPATPLPDNEPPPVVAPKLETLTDGDAITVDSLDALFRENKVAAHAGLTDKTMNVTGVVEKVFIRDHIDVRYIVLRGSQKKLLWPVRCTFSKEVLSEMHRLNQGQEVTLRGKYDGYGKNIIFKDCVLAR